MKYLILIFLSCYCLGQAQDNAPQVRDSFLNDSEMNGGLGTCSGTGLCTNFTEGTASQDLIVCGASQEDVTACGGGTGSNTGWQFQDSLSNNLTMLTMGNNGGTPGTSNNFYSRIGYICTTATNFPYRVSWTSGSSTPPSNCEVGFNCKRIKNACSSGTISTDGSIVTNSATATGAAITPVTNTVTTSSLHSLIFSMGVKAGGNGGSNRIQGLGKLGQVTYSINIGMAWQIAGTLGSNSFTWNDLRAVHNNTFASTIAFKVPMMLGDSVMPQAAIGEVYYAILHPYGGTSSAPTFACSGLPSNGLSLNTATGEITGTATAPQGTITIGCNFTDGTNTSSTRTLTIQVGASYRTPVLNSTQITNFQNGGATATVTGTNCGDIIHIQPQAIDDTHGGTGFKQVLNGSHGNFFSSSDGSPVNEYVYNTGSFAGPIVDIAIGPLVSGGTKVISGFNSTSSASGIVALISDWSNLQPPVDDPVVNNIIATTNPTANSVTYKTVVNNEVVTMSGYSGSVINPSFVVSTSVSAPFISDGNGNATFFYYQYGHYIAPTPTTLTPTFNLTETNWGCGSGNIICDSMPLLVTSFRPRLPIIACGEVTNKLHVESQVY